MGGHGGPWEAMEETSQFNNCRKGLEYFKVSSNNTAIFISLQQFEERYGPAGWHKVLKHVACLTDHIPEVDHEKC